MRRIFDFFSILQKKNIAPTIKEADLYHRAVALYEAREYEAVIELIQVGGAVASESGRLLNLAAISAQGLNNLFGAEIFFRKSIDVSPLNPKAHNNYGLLLAQMGRHDEAEAAFKRAISLDPSYCHPHYNMGSMLKDLGRPIEAAVACRRSVELDKIYGGTASLAINCLQLMCDWDQTQNFIDELRSRLRANQGVALEPWMTLMMPGFTPMDIKLAALQFSVDKYGPFFDRPPMVERNVRYQHDRMRIGYLCADFHTHPTVQLLAGVLEHHDRTKVAIYGYSYGSSAAPDASSDRVKAGCEVYREISNFPDEDAARVIAEDEIDILVDLNGHTRERVINALRPAPIIANWLGHPGTLGHERLADYIIGDAIVTPVAHAEYFSETLALMPHCYQPNDDKLDVVSAIPTRQKAGLPEEGFIFCSFNQSIKYNAETFDVWCRLLREIPRSVLWLQTRLDAAIPNLQREAVVRGVDAERLIFAPSLPLKDHLSRLRLADLALDTFPCNSHTTASDALRCGVPLLTLIGDAFHGRVAASLLHTLELPELITKNWDDYYIRARELALGATKLRAIREKLKLKLADSPLFDTPRFAKDLEVLYKKMLEHDVNALRPSIGP